jgi:hypothetical protein
VCRSDLGGKGVHFEEIHDTKVASHNCWEGDASGVLKGPEDTGPSSD